MLHRLLVLASVFCCAVIVVSFGLFARDQLAGASEQQQALLAAGSHLAPSGQTPPPAQASNERQPRRFIDAADQKLTGPFGQLAPAGSEWGRRLLQVIIGLLIYGVGLGYLRRFSSGRAFAHRPA